MPTQPDPPAATGTSTALWPALALALAGAGALLVRQPIGLGLLAAASMVAIAALIRQARAPKPLRIALWTVAIAAPLALMVAFTVRMAAPNVVTAGQKATERMAVATLRTLLWAEDQMIELRGRAGMLGELAGASTGPEGALPAPLLRPEFKALRDLKRGQTAAIGGYYFQVWAVNAEGTSATTEGPNEPPVAAGNTRWIAYAWPEKRGTSAEAVFCVNGHEDILQSANDQPAQHYDGLEKAPPWDACLGKIAGARLSPGVARDGGTWAIWRGKRTRRSKAADAVHGAPTGVPEG